VIAHFQKFSYFYLLSFLFITLGLGSLLTFSKGEVVYFFNNHQNDLLNFLFKNATYLGEWIGGTIIFFILLFFFQYKYSLLFLICILVSSLTSQFLKQVVYPNEKRPYALYDDLNDIENVKKSKRYSFPSGHTTAAFTIFSFLAFAGRTKIWQLSATVLAASVGISRIYLGQHFMNDVVAGFVLGLLLTATLYILLYPKFSKVGWMNKKLIYRK